MSQPMTRTSGDFEIVTLRRAERGADLWPAIEAAQYGRIVQRDEAAEGVGDAAAPGAFVAALAEVLEAWESAAPETQAALIGKLDAGLAALDDAGCRVHWGVVRRTVSASAGAPVEIPIAILRLGRCRDAAMEVAVPRTLAGADDGEVPG